MANKTIAIVDINNYNDQNIETLLFANILEKKYDHLTVLDLNDYANNSFIKSKKWAKKAEFSTTALFDNTNYISLSKTPQDENKVVNLIDSLKKKNDILLINCDSKQYKNNTLFYAHADTIIVFANFVKDLSKNILSFFLQHSIKTKDVRIVFHNYLSNIQTDKTYLSMLRSFSNTNIKISNIEKIPKLKSLKDIESIDPWLDLYQKINSSF